ncbi:Udp-glycosyltransferase 87a1 [Thalictrum thalictroides]|uniref:Glycosyltransferase n=1 Tax=Thalictrum thalictroides TaxID=46969 RepID=A0A7J6W0Y2_THATH|nr:Udp-glycosyltransferase 87a1 [Thalictrum thalictroides]
MSNSTSGDCHVVAVPYPGRGHVNPMMNLCKLLVSSCSNITITFVVTEEWLGIMGSSPKPSNITYQSIPNVIPSESIRASAYLEFLKAVNTKMEAPVEMLLDQLQLPVSAIIADTGMPWVLALGQRKNIPVVSLWTESPSVFSVFYHFDLLTTNNHFPADLAEQGAEVINYIPGITPTRLEDLPAIFSENAKKLLPYVLNTFDAMIKTQCVIFPSFYELEPHAIDTLKSTLPFPVYCVGPLIPHNTLDSITNDANLEYFKWLDSQPAKSVLYVSLGSFLSVSKEQMNEIVEGIRESGVRYFWVAREDTEQVQEAFGEMGLVVPWCNQLKVLCHSSVGGFLTHCGWNSTLEGVYAGVPMLTFPLLFDQTTDSKLIVDDWKIGMKVKKVATDKVVGRKEISELVQSFMSLDGDESKEMRRNASKFKKTCRQALSKGGSSEANLNALFGEILKCQ